MMYLTVDMHLADADTLGDMNSARVWTTLHSAISDAEKRLSKFEGMGLDDIPSLVVVYKMGESVVPKIMKQYLVQGSLELS